VNKSSLWETAQPLDLLTCPNALDTVRGDEPEGPRGLQGQSP
jgi:hypothetical protein